MRIIVMGTGPFAVPSCRQLVAAGHEIALVVVRPPANSKAPQAPVEAWAQEMGLATYQPPTINSLEAYVQLATRSPELYFVCDYGQILSKECLSIPKLGGINLHGSLLPRHRGAAPVQWTILSGDKTAGVSIIHMTPGLDAGPIISVRSTPVLRDENSGELEVRLSELGAGASLEAVELLAGWDMHQPMGSIQDKALATKAPRLAKGDGKLSCAMTASELERKVRGYQPWPGAFGELVYSETKRIQVHLRAARALSESTSESTSDRPIGAAWQATAASLGQVGDEWLAPWDNLLVIQTGSGLLAASLVQPAGKRAMTAAEFLRGHPLTSAAQFA